MAKLTEIFLAVALLSLLHSTLQAQGRGVVYGGAAALEWRPLVNTTAARRVVTPDAVTLKYCDRCTCCAQPVMCQTFNCCMESVCERLGDGSADRSKCDTKSVSCNCSTDSCK
ncbi:hypothetical protein ACP4OV_000412 [Aristida adscensionis]